MRQYAFIGLGTFATSMLERVAEVTDQIIVIDKDPALIDRVKDLVKTAFVADVLDEDALEKVLPDPVNVVLVDLAPNIEASLLATHRLKKLGVEEIIVKADSDEKPNSSASSARRESLIQPEKPRRELFPSFFQQRSTIFSPLAANSSWPSPRRLMRLSAKPSSKPTCGRSRESTS